MAEEVEFKLEIDPDNLPLLMEDSPFARGKTHTIQQVTVYYDTPETALKKHGFTLRVRKIGGTYIQTVKPATGAVGIMAREEIEFEIPTMEPNLLVLGDHPLLELVRGKDAPLVPIIRSEVERTTVQFERGPGRFKLDLDHGSIAAGDRSQTFAELEIELLEGSPASLVVAARRLADHAPLRLGVLTKAERGFLLLSGQLGKVAKADRVNIREGMTVADAFEIIVHTCLKHYRLNEPLVIRMSEAAALHQSRVAMRRLRSAFSLFKPAVEDVEFQHLRHELRWFTSQLGHARNLDVYLERDLEDEERDRIVAEREPAYEHVAGAMNSHRFRRLLIDIVGWTAIGAWRSGRAANRSIATFAGARLDKLWRTIATAGSSIEQMDESTRHGLRIEVKKLRYAIEFLRGLYPRSTATEKQFLAAVEALQESLGRLNDLATAQGIAGPVQVDDWLIGSHEERRHLNAAQEAYKDLLKAGPFWRVPNLRQAPLKTEDA